MLALKWSLKYSALALAVLLSSSCSFKHKKYENPITKDTQQPDKQLFDKAIHDIEKGRYEIARITLNTLVNTYDSSEYLAKAQLAIADAWYREGGLRGRMQAELEYKNFILFYPTMEEAAEAQSKICQSHIDQMNKADRDPIEALKAEQECRQLLVQFPNSKFAPETEQRLRGIQEVLASGEDKVGEFYLRRVPSRQRGTGWAQWRNSIRCTAARMKPCGRKARPTAGWARVSARARAMHSSAWSGTIR
jgi:outer membrane protein assembly factor BamD